jgi:hypothetical protein
MRSGQLVPQFGRKTFLKQGLFFMARITAVQCPGYYQAA